jgi:hypothetical protein
MDSIHSINGFYALSSFGNVFICDDALTDPKTVTFPNGYNLDSNLSFKVVFVNGHNCSNASTPMELNEIPVVVNKFGTLTPLPIHTITEGGITYYKSVMPNCVIEMYYTSDYDGNNHPAFVVVGNPVVLSSTDYTIYADGKNNEEYIRNQNILSDLEPITISKNSASPTIIEYDGTIYFSGTIRSDSTGSDYAYYILNGIQKTLYYSAEWEGFGCASCDVKKGDTIYLNNGWYVQSNHARWYKLRDYTGR